MTTPTQCPDTIPLFPLNVVLFPKGLLELRIFEIRYLDMIKDCLKTQKEFGVVLIKADSENAINQTIFYTKKTAISFLKDMRFFFAFYSSI